MLFFRYQISDAAGIKIFFFNFFYSAAAGFLHTDAWQKKTNVDIIIRFHTYVLLNALPAVHKKTGTMVNYPMSSMALLVIEGLWWTPEQKPKRPSVLAFLEGLESYKGDFNIYYSNFYEKVGFRRALTDDLMNTREDRLFLYVAAHGTDKRIGGLKSKTGMKIPEMFRVVRNAANYTNIEGVIIGSCSVGNNIGDFISTTKNSRIAWLFGYTCEISWMASTLIDVSIFEHLMKLKKSDLANRKKILSAFIKALGRFNGDYTLCKMKGKNIALKDAITLVVQPRSPGSKAQDETKYLLENLGWNKK
ncbi:MAG: hypothetical protein WC391_06470 [Methanoregula sp.]